jgi:hypothetical protein
MNLMSLSLFTACGSRYLLQEVMGMSGKSEAIGMHKMPVPLEIVIDEKQYNLGRWQYPRTAPDPELETFTLEILRIFRILEKAVIAYKELTLPMELCQEQLVNLAEWGMVAYRRFFDDEKARTLLKKHIAKSNGVPTFVSALTPFPWEVLYEGDDYTEGNPDMFWGLRYTPARILNPEMDIYDYPDEHPLPLDMLFCLHHQLVQSHQQERPIIEQFVLKILSKNRFSVLGGVGCSLTKLTGPKTSGKVLLEYLDTSTHNMVHFACHCGRDGSDDTLLFSLINDEDIAGDVPIIRLKTHDFNLVTGKFKYRPLVFLNACQSASGVPDDLGKTFNLPKVFIKHDAAAVIATICPIPDLFAAAFARVFYDHFLNQHMAIGDALRATRRHFLEKHHNPLGLAYGLYSPAHYRLATSPLVEGGVRL